MTRVLTILLGLSSAALLAVACARASETQFACSADTECSARGEGACVDRHCSKLDAGVSPSVEAGIREASAGRDARAGDATEGGQPLCPEGDLLSGPGGGFAPLYGCHETRRVGVGPACLASAPLRACTGRGNHLPSELPCGSCTAGDRCYTGIVPVCDCDGDGPMPAFLQDPGGDIGYVDGWLCQCASGTWQCLLRDQSGVSCSNVCQSDSGAKSADSSVRSTDSGVRSTDSGRD